MDVNVTIDAKWACHIIFDNLAFLVPPQPQTIPSKYNPMQVDET
jgi:hypothetical protein